MKNLLRLIIIWIGLIVPGSVLFAQDTPISALDTLEEFTQDMYGLMIDPDATPKSRRYTMWLMDQRYVRATAGNIPLSGGGTGTSLSDPGADRLMFFDNSLDQMNWLATGSGLSLSGTTLSLSNYIANMEDDGANFVNSASGTGYWKWENLAMNGNTFYSTNTNGDINIDPNGTGSAVITGQAEITTPNGNTNAQLTLEDITSGQTTQSHTFRSNANDADPSLTIGTNSAFNHTTYFANSGAGDMYVDINGGLTVQSAGIDVTGNSTIDGTLNMVSNNINNVNNLEVEGTLTVAGISGAAIGTDVQAYDADLTTYAGITPSANVQTLLGSANYSAFRSSLGVEDESIQDLVGAMFSGNTETGITVTYQDGDGTIDLVTSGITGSGTSGKIPIFSSSSAIGNSNMNYGTGLLTNTTGVIGGGFKALNTTSDQLWMSFNGGSGMLSSKTYVLGIATGGQTGLVISGRGNDSGSSPLLIIGGETDAAAAVSTRPVVSVQNSTTVMAEWNADGELDLQDNDLTTTGNITAANITGTTFTPTVTEIGTEISSTSANQTFYSRVGNVVTAYFSVDITTQASCSSGGPGLCSDVSVELSLPVSSNFIDEDDYIGLLVNTTSDRVIMGVNQGENSTQTYTGSLFYIVK